MDDFDTLVLTKDTQDFFKSLYFSSDHASDLRTQELWCEQLKTMLEKGHTFGEAKSLLETTVEVNDDTIVTQENWAQVWMYVRDSLSTDLSTDLSTEDCSLLSRLEKEGIAFSRTNTVAVEYLVALGKDMCAAQKKARQIEVNRMEHEDHLSSCLRECLKRPLDTKSRRELFACAAEKRLRKK